MHAADRIPVVLAWSGGKDSALALAALRRERRREVVGLLTAVVEPEGCVSMHRVPRALIQAQADALGLELSMAVVPEWPPNDVYEAAMAEALAPCRAAGAETVAFGDLFLADLRGYRERQMEALGMQCAFPLWGRDSASLARDFIAEGYRAVVCCVDSRRLPASFCGREFDAALLRDLPPEVDPCGENGEFHTFVYDGPGFSRRVQFAAGEVVSRHGFWYCNLTDGATETRHSRAFSDAVRTLARST
jgi:uncharacterized protein (TIGR00290 family)